MAVCLNDLLLDVAVNVPQLQLPEHCLAYNSLQLRMLLDECCIYLFVSHELERSGMGLFGIHENPYSSVRK